MNQLRIQRIIRHPVVIGGAVGLLAGLAAAAVLITIGEPWYAHQEEAVYELVYWLDFPAGSQIPPLTGWGWKEEEHRALRLAGTALNGLSWGAGGTAFVRRFRGSPRLRRTVGWAIAIEIPLIIALHATGVPSPMAGPNPPATAATLAHAPAFILLSLVGLCCGYESHFILSDFWGGPVQHPTTVAMAFLFASNVVVFVAVACAGGWLWRLATRRLGRRGAAAPVAPG